MMMHFPTKGLDDQNNIGVALVDSSRLYRESLKFFLEKSEIKVSGGFDDLEIYLQKFPQQASENLVIYTNNSTKNEHDIVPSLRDKCETLRIALLTSWQSGKNDIFTAVKAGVDGVLLSDLSPNAFIQSLSLICSGEKVLPAQLATSLIDGLDGNPPPGPGEVGGVKLTNREKEILAFLSRGDSNKLIALALDISDATVKVHVKSVLRKISAENRTQAAVWALENGLSDVSACGTD